MRCSSRRKAASPHSDAPNLKALIVAAGLGTRLRQIAPSKPLAQVSGVPLIQSVIESAILAGISEFVVVTGYEAAPLEAFLRKLARRKSLKISTVRNPDWTASNGLSVLAAEPLLDEQFVLLMADHLFEPALLSDLLRARAEKSGVALAVDRRLNNPLVDLDDVTRVQTDVSGAIISIGKNLATYNAFDTGIFLASKRLIEAIREDVNAGGNGSISAGMARLATGRQADAFDIGERFWLDVDDVTAWQHAERLRA